MKSFRLSPTVRRTFPLTPLCAALTAASLLYPAAARAQVGFAIDTDNLYTVNFGTVTSTLIGNLGLGLQTPEAIAQAPDGTLYVTDSSSNLYTVNSLTGAATLIGNTGIGNIEGLDFNGNTLLATDFNTQVSVFSLNVLTAAATPVVTAAAPTGLARTATVLDANTLLIRADNPGPNSLYDLNLTTGAVNFRGNSVSSGLMAAMDLFSNGTLYGLGVDGSFFSINPANGANVNLGNPGGQVFLGLTFGPGQGGGAAAPEPGALALLAVGGAAALLARRKGQPRA